MKVDARKKTIMKYIQEYVLFKFLKSNEIVPVTFFHIFFVFRAPQGPRVDKQNLTPTPTLTKVETTPSRPPDTSTKAYDAQPQGGERFAAAAFARQMPWLDVSEGEGVAAAAVARQMPWLAATSRTRTPKEPPWVWCQPAGNPSAD